jgi:glycosyltransferase involved in cell wall biosynthesis
MTARCRALFVNSGMLGHASVAALIREAVARDPGIAATHVDLSARTSVGERVVRRALCARPLGRTNLDLARWRAELYTGWLAARRIHGVWGSGFDVLHFHTQATAYASLGRMTRTPSIVSIDITQPLASLEAPPVLRGTYSLNVAHDGAVFARAAAIVATSRWAADDVARTYPDCASKVRVLPYPVRLDAADPRWIDARALRATTGLPVRFLFMGGDFPRKGGRELLRAWRDSGLSAGARLTLATDWPIAAGELPPGVDVVRGVRAYTTDWRALWRDADVFVMPTRGEAFGMVFQEAAAAGLPAIGTRLNAVPEIVEDGVTGLLVPPGDIRSLVDAMQRLAASAATRRTLGTAARARIERTGALERYASALTALILVHVHGVAPTAEASGAPGRGAA